MGNARGPFDCHRCGSPLCEPGEAVHDNVEGFVAFMEPGPHEADACVSVRLRCAECGATHAALVRFDEFGLDEGFEDDA